MNKQYKNLVRYANIIKDENFDFQKDNIFIRMTIFLYNDEKFLTICKNGECMSIEKI